MEVVDSYVQASFWNIGFAIFIARLFFGSAMQRLSQTVS